MNRDTWNENVRVGNRVWNRAPLTPETAAEWYGRLHVWSDDTVARALELLEGSPTGGRWPELAAIIGTCRDVERGDANRARAHEAASLHAPGLRLNDWLDAGAPGYPDGEHHARRIWAAVMRWAQPVEAETVNALAPPRLERHLQPVPDLDPDDVPIAP